MRVGLLVDGRRIRGNERQALLLVEGLVARGHVVQASCRRKGPVRVALEVAGARTRGIRPRGDADVISALAFAGWLRFQKLDVLLVTSWKRAAVAGWAARVAGVPRVVLRVGGQRGVGRGAGGRLRRFALGRWYHAAVVNSDAVRDDLVAAGMPADRVRVVANGIELESAPPAALRDELSLTDAHVLLITVGGLERNKGADLLVPILAAQDPEVHLVVAGSGTPKQRADLLMVAGAMGVGERLHLLGHRRDVPAVLAAADAFLLPSRADSQPNAMLEAMASGLPVIVSEVGGVRDALGARDGRPPAGWSAPAGDVAGLAAAVREVVADLKAGGEESSARGEEAVWRARSWFGAERMVREYEAVLAGGGVADA